MQPSPQLFLFDEQLDGFWSDENCDQQVPGAISMTCWPNGSVSMRHSFSRVHRAPLQNTSEAELARRQAPSVVSYTVYYDSGDNLARSMELGDRMELSMAEFP